MSHHAKDADRTAVRDHRNTDTSVLIPIIILHDSINADCRLNACHPDFRWTHPVMPQAGMQTMCSAWWWGGGGGVNLPAEAGGASTLIHVYASVAIWPCFVLQPVTSLDTVPAGPCHPAPFCATAWAKLARSGCRRKFQKAGGSEDTGAYKDYPPRTPQLSLFLPSFSACRSLSHMLRLLWPQRQCQSGAEILGPNRPCARGGARGGAVPSQHAHMRR